MKKIVLSTLLLSSIICGSNKSDELDQVIINSDLDTLQDLLPEMQLNANEYIRMADLAQQIINKRQSNLECFKLNINSNVNYDNYELFYGKNPSSPFFNKVLMGGFLTFAASVIITACISDIHIENSLWLPHLKTLLTTAIFTSFGVTFVAAIRASILQAREEIKIFNELKRLHDNSIQIKNLLLKQLANNEHQTVSFQLQSN